MSKFRQITYLAIAGGAASFAMLADANQSRAEDAKGNLPVIGSACDKSEPPRCDGIKGLAACVCGKWIPGDNNWYCDEHGAAYSMPSAYSGDRSYFSTIDCDAKPVPGFVGITKSGLRAKAGLSARNFLRI